MDASTFTEATRELAHRASGGIEVMLFWHPVDDTTSIELWHAATDETFRFAVPRERALEAFYHPLAELHREMAACTSL
jgi:hypothetical protein